jgi:ubiquinone/menaquinone biosynthesis C-methylase UbiE
MQAEFWNTRYAENVYAYGEKPNVFFAEKIAELKPEKFLLPAEGEGRNAVFAAKLGWDVTAFDYSSEGKAKALQLADKENVSLNYIVSSLEEMSFEPNSYDAIALIYAHFPGEGRITQLQRMEKSLKVGGKIIFEAFSKNHLKYVQLNPKVGGPKELSMLFSKEELLEAFPNVKWEFLKEEEVTLEEGAFHQGVGMVIRGVGEKE